MSHVMRKPFFEYICENKDADQLRSNPDADQRLCFRYTDSTIPLLAKSEFQASSHLLLLHSPVCVGPGRKPEDRFSHNEAHIKKVCGLAYKWEQMFVLISLSSYW